MSNSNGWVGIDLDGTLAKYDKWRGPEHIGEPIAPMVEYVKSLIANGIEVKIVTARAATSRILEDEDLYNTVITKIRQWCYKHLGKRLDVTAEKDFGMVFLVDDRVVAVEKNTGEFLTSPPSIASIKWHDDPKNPGNPDE